MERTVADIAYAAGLFDGEGTICITTYRKAKSKNPAKRYYILWVDINSTYLPIGEWLKTRLGGSTWIVQPKDDPKGRFLQVLPQIRWRIKTNACEQFLKLIIPFLIIKQEEAKIALAFRQEMRRVRGSYIKRCESQHWEKLASLRSLLQENRTKGRKAKKCLIP